jgi:hypothetical protein
MLMLGMNRRGIKCSGAVAREIEKMNRPMKHAHSTDTQINDSLILELVREVEKMNHPR